MQDFDVWVEKERLIKYGPLEYLKGSVIGVDASHFYKQFSIEPLLTALGGSPIALKGITDAVKSLNDAGIQLHFVFNGLQYMKAQDPFSNSEFINTNNAHAFQQYEGQQSDLGKRAFQDLGLFQENFCTVNFR